MLIWSLVILISVLVDQLTKQLVVMNLEVGESVDLIPGVLRFTYVQNEGAAFGMLADQRWVFMIISMVAIAGMFFYLWKFRPDSKIACCAIALIVGGGIGNMIDRIYLTYVIDFIDFCAFPKLWVWVFNVADACVCVGAGALMIWCVVAMIRESKNPQKNKKKKSEEAADASTDENS